MKKEEFYEWLRKRNEFQVKLTIGACAGMVALGLLALLIQGGLLYLLLSLAYGSKVLAAAVVLLLLTGMGAYTWKTAPQKLADTEHDVQTGFSSLSVRLAPTLSSAWTFAMGSMESDQSIPERIVSMFMLIPRFAWTAWYVFQRIEQVKAIDAESCGKVIRMVLKRSERVDASAIAEKFKTMDLPVTFRQLSLIDGVVFLTKDSVGISLANRFKDDLEQGASSAKPVSASSASPFD